MLDDDDNPLMNFRFGDPPAAHPPPPSLSISKGRSETDTLFLPHHDNTNYAASSPNMAGTDTTDFDYSNPLAQFSYRRMSLGLQVEPSTPHGKAEPPPPPTYQHMNYTNNNNSNKPVLNLPPRYEEEDDDDNPLLGFRMDTQPNLLVETQPNLSEQQTAPHQLLLTSSANDATKQYGVQKKQVQQPPKQVAIIPPSPTIIPQQSQQTLRKSSTVSNPNVILVPTNNSQPTSLTRRHATHLTIRDLEAFPLKGLVAQFPAFGPRFGKLDPELQYYLETTWHSKSDGKAVQARRQFLDTELHRATFDTRVEPNVSLLSAGSNPSSTIALDVIRSYPLSEVLAMYPKFAAMFYEIGDAEKEEIKVAWVSNLPDDVVDMNQLLTSCLKGGVFRV
eukprot:PhF_6_TR34182/c0_g1_i2/m.50044